MMRLYFILLLIVFVSCGGHSNSEFKLQDSICINAKDCFYFSTDSNLYQIFMYFSNAELKEKKLIDTVDFSPYKSKIHSFQSQNNESYVVLWETEYEFYPLIYVYFITAGKIVKIGELLISLPCQSCESFEYPLKDIRMLQKGKNIEISFLKDVNYKPSNGNEWHLYKAGMLKCIFNAETNKLK